MKLKRSLFTLAFLSCFMLFIAIASTRSETGAARSAGSFDKEFTLYAFCYDCADDEALPFLKRDLELLHTYGYKLVLPSEITTLDADSALIILKNTACKSVELANLFENGLKCLIVPDSNRIASADSKFFRRLVNDGKAEAAISVSDISEHGDCSALADIFCQRLELMSALGITVGTCFLTESENASMLSNILCAIGDFVLLSEGSGVNRIDCHSKHYKLTFMLRAPNCVTPLDCGID